MKKVLKKVSMISAIALVFAAVGLLQRSYSAPSSYAQETISGDWTAKVKQTDKGPVLWLSLNHGSDGRRGGSQMSCDSLFRRSPASTRTPTRTSNSLSS